ncbi:MAG TPA: hypothetical protein ENK32_00630 [Anaerolineae bacterium]|nr:hypothetical protein [Anaerolineae bacterium]
MPNSIDDYYQSLLSAAAQFPFIHSSNISLDKRTSQTGLIRGDLYLADGSRLHFRELIELQTTVVRHMYSYHYQDADNILIFRYDDTPHYPDLPNFPHHKHVGSQNRVVTADAPTFAQVLQEIESAWPLPENK